MKILFLHLSDMHIKSYENIETLKIQKIIDALNVTQGFDECIIIFSGDLTSSGNVNEYKSAKYLFGNLISKLKVNFPNKFLNLLLVPGNHDADFTKVKRIASDIQKYYDDSKIDQHIDEEINMFKNFYDYSDKNKCFKYEKICERKILKFGEYNIQVNLVNTALFSTIKPDDKELHYFPQEKLSMLRKQSNANIAITVMHHSTEWFHWKSKKNLEDSIYNNSSILFLGHDHDLSTKELNVNNYNNLFISAGGEFSNKDIICKSEFNAIILNTESNSIDSYAFKWDNIENMYKHEKQFENRDISTNTNILTPSKIYIDSIKEDEKRKVTKDFTQYFVFPTLTGKYKEKYLEKTEISNLKDFINELHKKKYINVIGRENAGKTTLLKVIFINLISEMTPLFFTIDNIKGKSIDKIVKLMFEDQYSEEPMEYEKYQQLEKSRKVAIIDDYDMIKKDKIKFELIKELKNQFDYVIIGTKDSGQYNIMDSVRNEIDEKNEFFILKINDFYLKKRHDLIKSVCKVSKQMNDKAVENIVTTIDGFVKNQFQLFDLDPDFIIQFTQYFLEASNLQNEKSESIFNKIFETNIYNAIIQNSKRDLIEETITALEEIAYYIHFNKKDPLPLDELEKVINKYNEDYSLDVNVKLLVDRACKAKILKYAGDSFAVKFSNKNHLAFFVAKCLSRRLNNEGSFEDIDFILKNICFGINDNIILFISYLTSNTKIIMSIYEAAESLIKEWEEFDLDKGNIKFLTKIKVQQEVKAPKKEDKDKIEKAQNQIEKERKREQIIECKTLYDYDESQIDKIQYKILRALKYTEMLSKSLPNFHSILIKENKQKLTDAIYTNPNKILLQILKPDDIKFTQNVKEIKSFVDLIGAKNKKGMIINESEIEIMFYNIAVSIILSLYNQFAYLSTDKKSISMLNNYDLNNSNYKIFNLMAEENYGITEEFTKKAECIYNNTKDKTIKTMVQLIVRKHLIFNENIKFSKRQHLVDTFFSFNTPEERKNFFIETQKEITQ